MIKTNETANKSRRDGSMVVNKHKDQQALLGATE